MEALLNSAKSNEIKIISSSKTRTIGSAVAFKDVSIAENVLTVKTIKFSLDFICKSRKFGMQTNLVLG